MCKETGQKLRLLKTIFLLLDPEKKKLVFNALVRSYYSHHPLVWIVIHERSHGTVYNDTNNTLQELLQRNRSVSILHKNHPTLTMEVYKIVNNICPPIMKTLFDFRENR